MNILKDSFGRKFPYIRLSISDVCNFKCGYCLPDGYKIDKSDNRSFLNIEEIGRLAKALSELGVSKIRLTGGEPTVRKDFFEIVKIIKKNSGIKKTVITTNGYRLDKIANDVKNSGLDGINISIDSLNAETFKKITGHDRLEEILRGIKNLQKLNFKNIKINAVLLKGVNDSEKDFNDWAEFVKNNEIDIDFLLSTNKQIRYNKRNNRLYLDVDWGAISAGTYIVIDCQRIMDPANYAGVYNDSFLKRYFTSKVKRQWGQNLIKFQGVKLPGGIELNGRQIYEDAVQELQMIEDKMLSTYEIPPLDLIG